MRPGVLPVANTGAPRPLMPMRSRRGLPKSSRLAMSNSEVKFDPRLDPDPHPLSVSVYTRREFLPIDT